MVSRSFYILRLGHVIIEMMTVPQVVSKAWPNAAMVPQALFPVVQCVLCLAVPVVVVKLAGYDLGYAAGFYSGSQTISAATGLVMVRSE